MQVREDGNDGNVKDISGASFGHYGKRGIEKKGYRIFKRPRQKVQIARSIRKAGVKIVRVYHELN